MLSASLLIIIIQMISECQNVNCLLQAQKLTKLLQNERKNHVMEVRQIEQSLEFFAKTKREQCANLQMIADKLAFKVEKYKSRCCNLNDRIKQENQTIKSLNSKVAALEVQLKDSKDQISREKTIQYDQSRIMSGLRQTITLQQSQIKELTLKVDLQGREIQNLSAQLASKINVQSRFRNAECISEEQYQRQTALLRETLKLQFNKSTSELFNFPSPRKETDFSQEKTNFAEPQQNQYQTELRILANTLQYGTSYVSIIQVPELTLKQSQNVLKAYKNIAKKNSQYQEEIANLRDANQNLIETLRVKLAEMEENIGQQLKQTNSVSVQTPFNDVIDQLTQTNSFLRIKVLELSQLIGKSVHFAAYLYHLSSYSRQKLKYYKRYASKQKKQVRGGRKTFKQIALSVLFIEYLSRKARKTRTNIQKINYLSKINVADTRLQYLLLKCLTLQQSFERKNPVIERILKQRAKISSENILTNFSQMIQQEAIGISLSKDHQLDTDVFKIRSV